MDWLSRSTGRICRLSAAGAVLAVLASCMYRGDIDQPVTLKATWFSYLNGDDIRTACAPGRTWYRLVQNADYDVQIRSYEVVAQSGGGGLLTARVINGGGIDLTRLSITDLQAPGRWITSQTPLDRDAMAALEGALAVSGAFAPAPAGLRLASEEFYWIFAGCRNGQVQFNAWRYPSDRYAALAFPEFLYKHDRTGVPVNPPHEVTPIDRGSRQPGPAEDPTPRFDLEVGEGGLKGVFPLF